MILLNQVSPTMKQHAVRERVITSSVAILLQAAFLIYKGFIRPLRYLKALKGIIRSLRALSGP